MELGRHGAAEQGPLPGAGCVPEVDMTIWQKLFSGMRRPPRQRVRICLECGMPLAEHKEWCSILRTLQEQRQRALQAAAD